MKTTTANFLWLVCAFVGAAAAGIACGAESKPAAAPEGAASGASENTATSAPPAKDTLGAGVTADAGSQPAAIPVAADETSTAPLAQVLDTDTAAIQKMYDAAKVAPSIPTKANATTSDPLVKGIREVAQRLPGGMKPEGPLAIGTLREKEHLQMDISLQPGKCYSIVGYSKKVKDLDLYLFMPPGILSGQDLSDDNKPVVGGPPQPMCPVGSHALSYKLAIFADKGAGDIAVQLYSKGN